MSKFFRIEVSGFGSSAFVQPLTNGVLDDLREGGLEEDELSIEDVCDIIDVEHYQMIDDVYSGINVGSSLTENMEINVFDENDILVWSSDEEFEFYEEDIEERILCDDDNYLMIQDMGKGEFMVYEIEVNEDFDSALLSPIHVELLDGELELIVGLKYDGEELDNIGGSFKSQGLNFYLYEL